jgi:hypothetical protein
VVLLTWLAFALLPVRGERLDGVMFWVAYLWVTVAGIVVGIGAWLVLAVPVWLAGSQRAQPPTPP